LNRAEHKHALEIQALGFGLKSGHAAWSENHARRPGRVDEGQSRHDAAIRTEMLPPPNLLI
jgi:hypothetical protein